MKEISMQKRVAIVDLARSPFAKSWTVLNGVDPISLSTQVTRELLFRNNFRPDLIEHIVETVDTGTSFHQRLNFHHRSDFTSL